MNYASKANMIRQVINLEDGGTKVIFHQKDHATRGDHKQWWNEVNKTPNPNSKRQQKLLKEDMERRGEETVLIQAND